MLKWRFIKIKSICLSCYLDDNFFLFSSNRIPEAALMARSYLPSKVSEIVALWRKDLSKVTYLSFYYNLLVNEIIYYMALS